MSADSMTGDTVDLPRSNMIDAANQIPGVTMPAIIASQPFGRPLHPRQRRQPVAAGKAGASSPTGPLLINAAKLVAATLAVPTATLLQGCDPASRTVASAIIALGISTVGAGAGQVWAVGCSASPAATQQMLGKGALYALAGAYLTGRSGAVGKHSPGEAALHETFLCLGLATLGAYGTDRALASMALTRCVSAAGVVSAFFSAAAAARWSHALRGQPLQTHRKVCSLEPVRARLHGARSR